MPSSTSSFERIIPAAAWGRIGIVAALLTAACTAAWEVHARSRGYLADVNDTTDVWADRRAAVESDSIVIIGDSRPLFDLDLNTLEAGLGKRPIQLAIAGSCGYPILQNLADDEEFKGTVICSILPALWTAPGGPLLAASIDALERHRTRSPAQRFGHHISMFLEERFAFLNAEDLNLANLLLALPISNRPGALVPPRFPPTFQTMDRERRTTMLDACVPEGSPMQRAVKASWQRLFLPPPPPTWIPPEQFGAMMQQSLEARFAGTAAAVKKISARGGKVVFVRFPHTEWIKDVERQATPRAAFWDRFVAEAGSPAIHFEDYPDLAGFTCPEWSHLSGPDSIEFSKRFVPHLKKALAEYPPAG